MRIFVKAKPNAKSEEVIKIDDTHFEISVKEPPVRGMANKAIVEALAKYFNCSRDNVKIISGYTSRQKIVEIAD